MNEPKEKMVLQYIPIHKLSKGEFQPRIQFEPKALEELAQTLKEVGMVLPLVVRPKSNGHYEIIAGERRWRAAQLADLKEVPCLISQDNNEEALVKGLIENLTRQNLNPIEEARGFERLIEEFDFDHEALANKFGKSRSEITNRLRLLKLDPKVHTLLISGDLSETHGRLLAGLPTVDQFPLARLAVAKNWSSRALEKAIQSQKNLKENKISKKSSGDLQQLEQQLSEYLGAQVKLETQGAQKGHIKIQYHSLDELDGILAKIGWQYE